MLQPNVVTDAILYAAEHPSREIVVGGPAKLLITMQNIAPRLVDDFFKRVGWESQKTSEPRSTSAPNPLFEPVHGQDRVEGDFSDEAQPTSIYTWLQINPIARWLVSGAALVAMAAFMSKAVRRE